MTNTVRSRVAALVAVCLLAVLVPARAWSQTVAKTAALSVVSAGPNGEIASLDEANEVRVVFSEPMVALGRIPQPITAPFFTISPAVKGTFRWSGTTILIFTPDQKAKLPYATTYQVKIDATAQATSGRRLARPYTFSFTTPTVHLLATHWYRRGRKADGNLVVLLQFNQPVRPDAVAAHLTAHFEKHEWKAPGIPAAAQARMKSIDPTSVDRFNAKVASTAAAAASTAPVTLKVTSDWDRSHYPASPSLVAVESVTPVPPESWVKLTLDAGLPSPAGRAVPGHPQDYRAEVGKAFFIDGFACTQECDPEARNHLVSRSQMDLELLARATSVTDITTPGSERPVKRGQVPDPDRYVYRGLTLGDLGFPEQPPARTYAVTVAPTVRSADGQALGYTWVGIVENWHKRAFTSFDGGQGVWESSGGPVLPFYARNFQTITQWMQAVPVAQLMSVLETLRTSYFHQKPDVPGETRKLPVKPDAILSHGLDLKKVLSPGGTGLVWAAVEEGQPIAHAKTSADTDRESPSQATLVQATNLGVTVKDSPQNTLVFVTRLDTGAPVSGAHVSIVQTGGSIFWTGTTDNDGIAIAPNTPLRSASNPNDFSFIVTAEKDGDVAYTSNDWNSGIHPWTYRLRFDLAESEPLLRGSVFADRGVYRAGEEVHLKAILRHNTAQGIQPLAAGTRIGIVVSDSEDRRVAQRVVTVGQWSSVETSFTLRPDARLGDYSVVAAFESDLPKQEQANPEPEEGAERGLFVHPNKSVRGSFLVAAYRRPDFRVDVKLPEGQVIAGTQVKGTITARYLFGAPMGGRPVKWNWTRSYAATPDALDEHFPEDTWTFISEERSDYGSGEVARDEGTLAKDGTIDLELDTTSSLGRPLRYTLEGDVEDVSRQHISNRATILVHPGPFYVGLRRPSYFVDQKAGLKSATVTVTPEGKHVAGVKVELTLTRTQWQSVRRAQANGFFTWETTEQKTQVGQWTITSAEQAVPFETPLTEGGYYRLQAVATDNEGHTAIADTEFYVLGAGYTAWRRYDHNRIELIPERQKYRPGDTARIMVQSPWENATALVTTEREGVRTHRQFALTSTQQSIAVPITEADIPNVFVSVLLVKGRTNPPPTGLKKDEDESDPGKPSFRLGYVELAVENAAKRLHVDVRANREEFRPATTAKVNVEVKDRKGTGVASEVTLWAVDYGVLSLTGYQTPDVLDSVYVHKALQVMTTDNRQQIVSRRVLTPKGAEEPGGGGGGEEGGVNGVRRDFRVLAFWLGSVVTGADGRASVDVKLPESLTTYRIMAVAGDLQSRFGSGDSEVRINKPITMKSAFPRFLAVGDTAFFGAVITNQLKDGGQAKVTMKSLDPNVLLVSGTAEQTVQLPANGSLEVRFPAAGRAIGNARVQMSVQMGKETDAFEDVIPVEVLSSPETVAAYGEAGDTRSVAAETLVIPAGVVAGFGGLQVEIASTAMVGLSEGAQYLVEYPYGCAEQRGSKALALALAADLGDAFKLPGMEAPKMRDAVQTQMKELEAFQCSDGGFGYWTDSCPHSSEYLTAYLLHVFKVAGELKYQVNPGMTERAYAFLEQRLAEPPPDDHGWWPAYSAWQAFAVKVLAEGGRNEDSNITRLYGYRDRMPIFALAYLRDALVAKGEKSGERFDDLQRRMTNAILPEAGSAHVEELSDDYLLWFWNSNVRSTAIVLNTLARSGGGDTMMRPLVRWLIAVRRDGRWSNTQENAMAMEALVSYYRKYESVVPDFRGTVSLGGQELARHDFKGRSTQATTTAVPMAQVLTKGKPGTSLPLTFKRDGAGTLFYTARFRYAADAMFQEGMDNGIRIERTYEPYLEKGSAPPSTTYKAGDLIRVTLTLYLTKERRYVAVTDPLPAGCEPIESWFQTTASALARATDEETHDDRPAWWSWWQHGGFDHVERKDDRVDLFATRLSVGKHAYSYIVRATTAGTFRTAPAHAEEMYEPEVFGRTATAVVEVKR